MVVYEWNGLGHYWLVAEFDSGIADWTMKVEISGTLGFFQRFQRTSISHRRSARILMSSDPFSTWFIFKTHPDPSIWRCWLE